jgi:hypothetical protein
METEKNSVTVAKRVDNSEENLFYSKMLDVLTDPDGPHTCKLLSELSTMSEIGHEKNG